MNYLFTVLGSLASGGFRLQVRMRKKLKTVYGTSSFKLNFSILSYISEDLLLFLLQVFHKVTKNSDNILLNDVMKQTPVRCHMASHMALAMSSVFSGECVVCGVCKQI